MKVLIIGFGSIGKRHFEILNSFKEIEQIDIVSKQLLSLDSVVIYKDILQVTNLDQYDYFIIANETAKHFVSLNYLVSKVDNKQILVEKPLFAKNETLSIQDNKVYTAYNLRFHLQIEYIKEQIKKRKVLYANLMVGQYLPLWRPGQNYKKSYSANIESGGGVLRDLSHELDLVNWLFGDIKSLHSINKKISNLEITSDDLFTAVGETEQGTVINLSMDYISRIPLRQVIVHLQNMTLIADLISGITKVSHLEKACIEKTADLSDKNQSYTKLHRAILYHRGKSVCSYHEGLKINAIIDNVEFKYENCND